MLTNSVISGPHGDEYEDGAFLGYCAVLSDGSLRHFECAFCFHDHGDESLPQKTRRYLFSLFLLNFNKKFTSSQIIVKLPYIRFCENSFSGSPCG